MTTAVLERAGVLSQRLSRAGARPLRIAFASGGTGGHLYPGLAVARAMVEKNSLSRCLFLISEKVVEANILAAAEFDHRSIPSAAPRWGQASLFARKLCAGFIEARKAFHAFQPQALLALGGFASFAPALAARSMGIPVFVQEQNRVVGRANTLLALLAKAVFVPYAGMQRQLRLSRVFVTGNPVRHSALRVDRDISLRELGLKQDKLTVLVLGGSQGAHFLNALVAESLERLADWRQRVQWIHLTGAQDLQAVKDAYAQRGWDAVAMSFFERMGLCYGACDLVVSRAGASTVAEIMANGLASVLIPYPDAMRDHQRRNAEGLGEKGAAMLLDQSQLNASSFSTALQSLLRDPGRLMRMGAVARKFHAGDAAEAIADKIDRLIR